MFSLPFYIVEKAIFYFFIDKHRKREQKSSKFSNKSPHNSYAKKFSNIISIGEKKYCAVYPPSSDSSSLTVNCMLKNWLSNKKSAYLSFHINRIIPTDSNISPSQKMLRSGYMFTCTGMTGGESFKSSP